MARMGDTRVFRLADGRDLAFQQLGAPDGAPVIAMHGSPGSRTNFTPVADDAAELAVRLIAVDRPGYGHSTFHPARTFESWARDVGQLADHLGLDRVGVIGWSSGGPNALSCARFLADRLTACVVVAGPAPPEANIVSNDEMTINRIGKRVAAVAPRVLGSVMHAALRQAQRNPERALEIEQRAMPEPDRAVLEQPRVRAGWLAYLSEPLSATAGRTAAQDLHLEARPWGFDVRDITARVHIWHGDRDRNVALANGLYLARTIPGATLHRIAGAAHALLYDHFAEMMAPLLP